MRGYELGDGRIGDGVGIRYNHLAASELRGGRKRLP